jgi:hypothetical protein
VRPARANRGSRARSAAIVRSCNATATGVSANFAPTIAGQQPGILISAPRVSTGFCSLRRRLGKASCFYTWGLRQRGRGEDVPLGIVEAAEARIRLDGEHTAIIRARDKQIAMEARSRESPRRFVLALTSGSRRRSSAVSTRHQRSNSRRGPGGGTE